jgi:hypothetical protein
MTTKTIAVFVGSLRKGGVVAVDGSKAAQPSKSWGGTMAAPARSTISRGPAGDCA